MSIFIYQNTNGKIPFYNWYLKVKKNDVSIFRKTNYILKMMSNNSLPLKRPLIKHMVLRLPYRNIYKLRLGKYRLIFLIKNNNYYILHVFRKKTQQTPEKERLNIINEVRKNNFICINKIMNDKK